MVDLVWFIKYIIYFAARQEIATDLLRYGLSDVFDGHFNRIFSGNDVQGKAVDPATAYPPVDLSVASYAFFYCAPYAVLEYWACAIKMTLQGIDAFLLNIIDVDDDMRYRLGFSMKSYKNGLLNIYTNLEALKIFVEAELEALDYIAEDCNDDENDSYRVDVEDFEDEIFDTEPVFEMVCMLTDESYSLPRISEVQYGRPYAIVEPSPADIIAEWVFKRRPKS